MLRQGDDRLLTVIIIGIGQTYGEYNKERALQEIAVKKIPKKTVKVFYGNKRLVDCMKRIIAKRINQI